MKSIIVTCFCYKRCCWSYICSLAHLFCSISSEHRARWIFWHL